MKEIDRFLTGLLLIILYIYYLQYGVVQTLKIFTNIIHHFQKIRVIHFNYLIILWSNKNLKHMNTLLLILGILLGIIIGGLFIFALIIAAISPGTPTNWFEELAKKFSE